MADINETINDRFEDMKILDEMKTSYLNYAMSVIVSRALPDVRDGLKPSQRRILVAMNDLNLGPRGKHRKCAKIVGDTSGNYHPHGDQATYGTLVRLGQHWNMRYTLVDPQGNFGSIDADPPAAMRYTEARFASPAPDMMEDIEKDTVDFVPNYDETRKEPVVLPSKFPNLLVNGASGIAVGMATNIAPHNLNEVCDALLLMIDNPDCTFKDILEVLPGPDFPTGGIICGRKGILDAYVHGRGHLKVRAKHHIEESKRGKISIIFTEIPYMVVKATIVSKIADCVREGTIPEISDVRDESDRKGMRIVVEVRKDADENVVLNKLYRYTPLQNTFAINNVALVNSRPETLNIKQMLKLYIEHRLIVIRRRTRYLLKKARNRAHILEGLILAVSDIDEIIELIKKSPDAPTAKINLMEKPLKLVESETLRRLLPESFVSERHGKEQFLTGPQADAILTMQLQRLTGLEIEKLAKEYGDLTEKIEGYEALLSNKDMQFDVVREDIHEIKGKYGDDRRTNISEEDLTGFDLEDLITEEEVLVMISHQGYMKRMPIDTYRKQARGGRGIIGSSTKEDDFIEHLFTASTHDYLLVFTTGGICYWLKVYNIPAMSRQSKGRNIANLLDLGDDSIASILNVREFDDQRQLLMATRNGIVKKTVLSAYGNPRSNGVKAVRLDEGDWVIGVDVTSGENEIILGTEKGMTIRFHEADARSMGRVSRGVKGISLAKDDAVVGMVIVEEGASLLTACENGYGKRTALEEYRVQSRGGKGIINIKGLDRNGKVIAIKAVQDEDDIMMITAQGMIIRTGLEEVRVIGRSTSGVRMINLKKDDKLVAVERLSLEEEEEAAESAQNGEESSSEAEGSAEPDENAEE
ncbi:DNA gyrase subunit A [Anaerohalosphaera lusitana]|uniref:DNA gyrase subunit A n=1 Tax=Anaerohalosphaera lusitana TaxID=1936003 RepID=A0A1U9NP62_9BACT|nr:DNA gyrase subunit A [Anaerohalosphaera lusitana]AQT69508.1 DNA gyrase subunit A [Anaerohalosphaera lusitana]